MRGGEGGKESSSSRRRLEAILVDIERSEYPASGFSQSLFDYFLLRRILVAH
jgi:hypothetical protein